MFKVGQHYDQLVSLIIRPPRLAYSIQELGPRNLYIEDTEVQRLDFELINKRGHTLQCSHWEPTARYEKSIPCVIYCHGNGGGRLDALDVVRSLLPCNIGVLALDFSGSGLSDGEYVSLGVYERKDLAVVVEFLRELGRISTIGLWGRSMGAVTALLYAMEDPSIGCVVLDSPFSSLSQIAQDLVLTATEEKMPRLTKMAVSLGLKAIRSSIKKKASFDIRELEILNMVEQCYVPALFIHGEQDSFVLPEHSARLHRAYAGEKTRVLVEGDHNSPRPQFFMDSAAIFITNSLIPPAPRAQHNRHSTGKIKPTVTRMPSSVSITSGIRQFAPPTSPPPFLD